MQPRNPRGGTERTAEGPERSRGVADRRSRGVPRDPEQSRGATGVRAFLGLGNPGRRYQATYHNAGALAVGLLASRDGVNPRFRQPRGYGAVAVVRDGRRTFAKATTFMNDSGRAASELLSFAGLSPAELAVVHDDADLALGTVRTEFGRGAAGHHGVASVIAALRTNRFWRIRIGIRPPEEAAVPHGNRERRPAEEFVLRTMRREERASIEAAVRREGVRLANALEQFP